MLKWCETNREGVVPIKRMLCTAMTAVILLLTTGVASAQTEDGATRIHLIHGIPGVDVDVDVDGAPTIEGFGFGQTRDLTPLAGTTLAGVVVRAAGTAEIVADAGDVALPTSGNHTVLAHRDAQGQPTLTVFENDLTPLPVGRGGIVVRHAAAGPAVDVLLDGLVAFDGLENGQGRRAELPEFTLAASIVPAGTTGPAIFGPADLQIVEGQTVIVYAVGSVDAGIGVVSETIVGTNSAPNRVNTGASPLDVPLDQTIFVFVMMGIVAAVGTSFVGRSVRTART